MHLFCGEISSHSAVSKQLSSAECWCWLAWYGALQLQPTWAALLSRRAYCACLANFKNESESAHHSRTYVLVKSTPRSSVSAVYFHFHFWSWRDLRNTHVATVAPPKWAEVAVHNTRPASTNTQLSSAACWLLNDCWSLLQINATVLAALGELGVYPCAYPCLYLCMKILGQMKMSNMISLWWYIFVPLYRAIFCIFMVIN